MFDKASSLTYTYHTHKEYTLHSVPLLISNINERNSKKKYLVFIEK